jgi:homoserine kinase type II
MSLYSSLQKEEIEAILQNYDIGTLIRYEVLKGGVANTNYVVETDKGKYVLTRCDHKSFLETRMLADLLVHLAAHQFESSQLIRNRSGGHVGLFKDKPVLLKGFIMGEVSSHFGEEVLVKLGRALARLNQIPAPDYLPTSFPYGEQAFTDIDEGFSNHPFFSWLSKKHEYIKKSLLPELPKSMIHGDLFYSNVVVTNDQQPIIMDFEEACYYYRIFDLGMAVVGLCCEHGQIVPSKMRALIKGYQNVKRLTPQEAANLKAFIVYGATATAFWRFKQFNIVHPVERLKDTYKEMMAIADQAYSFSEVGIVF